MCVENSVAIITSNKQIHKLHAYHFIRISNTWVTFFGMDALLEVYQS